MIISKKILLIPALILAGMAQPVFADTTVHAFLWNAEEIEMAQDYKLGDNANRLSDEMGIALSVDVVPAGEVTFDVMNSSSELVHEMVLAKLPSDGVKMPYDEDIDRVDEDVANAIGEVSELEPNASGKLTLNLEAGTYILFCNLPGHYSSGMWRLITVK